MRTVKIFKNWCQRKLKEPKSFDKVLADFIHYISVNSSLTFYFFSRPVTFVYLFFYSFYQVLNYPMIIKAFVFSVLVYFEYMPTTVYLYTRAGAYFAFFLSNTYPI